jgi:Transposase
MAPDLIDGDPERFGTADALELYRKLFTTMVPDAIPVADPFHLAKLANAKLVDACRRRVRKETMEHRGHKSDPFQHLGLPPSIPLSLLHLDLIEFEVATETNGGACTQFKLVPTCMDVTVVRAELTL